MMTKFAVGAVLAALAVGVANGSTFHTPENNNIVSLLEKESRLLELPKFGAIAWKGAKIAFFLLKSAWALIGFKVGAIALIANFVIWAFKHSFKIVIGAVAMFGFCKLTNKCSLDNVPKSIIQVGDSLYYAARQLENGAAMYETNHLY